MNRLGIQYWVMFLSIAGLCSCGNGENNAEETAAKADFVAEKNLVDTIILRKKDFSREIISNGNLRALRRAELKFATQGEIEKVNVRNGSYVERGDLIAALDASSLKFSLDQSHRDLERAELEFADKLIGFGYGTDTSNVPKDMLKVAKIRSGYSTALHNYEVAKFNYANATLRAPFSGVIANLEAKPYEQSGQTVCTVIDDSSFDVEFNLLESELSFVRPGQVVRISPFTDLTSFYSGRIRDINPMVDEKGQVKIIAAVDNKGKKLMDGMNVKVFIESSSLRQLSVPKSAVVIRDGYDVLFTLDTQSMKAEWVYVDVLQSNSTDHVVRGNVKKNAELNEGQVVIVSGNLNLADRSTVEIKKR